MKILKIAAIILVTMIANISTTAQKITLDGDIDALKDEKSMTIEFNYDSMKIGKYNNTNDDYVAHKKDDLNKKYPGKGDAWALVWVEARKAKYEPAFKEGFESSSAISTNAKSDSKYTLILKTTFIEPGFHIKMIAKENAVVNAEAWIVENSDKNKIVATINIERAVGKAPGDNDEDTYNRISNAYKRTGEALGNLIKGKSK
jgi:hypothetical protein